MGSCLFIIKINSNSVRHPRSNSTNSHLKNIIRVGLLRIFGGIGRNQCDNTFVQKRRNQILLHRSTCLINICTKIQTPIKTGIYYRCESTVFIKSNMIYRYRGDIHSNSIINRCHNRSLVTTSKPLSVRTIAIRNNRSIRNRFIFVRICADGSKCIPCAFYSIYHRICHLITSLL